jgi:hypothetical protein
MAMKTIYLSGSDIFLFIEPELLAAACIHVANLKGFSNAQMRNDMKEFHGIDNCLGIDILGNDEDE